MSGHHQVPRASTSNKYVKRAIKAENDMALVFDNRGEQIWEYQGQYHTVRRCIMRATSPDTIFHHVASVRSDLLTVPKEAW